MDTTLLGVVLGGLIGFGGAWLTNHYSLKTQREHWDREDQRSKQEMEARRAAEDREWRRQKRERLVETYSKCIQHLSALSHYTVGEIDGPERPQFRDELRQAENYLSLLVMDYEDRESGVFVNLAHQFFRFSERDDTAYGVTSIAWALRGAVADLAAKDPRLIPE